MQFDPAAPECVYTNKEYVRCISKTIAAANCSVLREWMIRCVAAVASTTF